MRKLLTSLAAAVAFGAGTASAQSFTFSTSSGVQPSNVGFVRITQVNATTVTVLADLLNEYGFMNSGQRAPFSFTLAGSEAGLSAMFQNPLSGTYPTGQFSLSTVDVTQPGFGLYGVNIVSTAGNGSNNAYYGDLQFNLTRATGLSIDDFLANTNNFYFAADLTDGRSTGSQGWADRGARITSTVPEPSTYALMASGLLGIFGFARRRRNMAT